ncbi:hypothetical protein [Vulcanisaeta sp. JCM 16159]|uniref:hypothetical protein n=1 Tax=Vulcanisaeta sp. JCM 16159 TaxID=1295371 RepID=UPI001FB40887|nr:hypothetical protein [Vulcanisaeta sp. JCM 16159]
MGFETNSKRLNDLADLFARYSRPSGLGTHELNTSTILTSLMISVIATTAIYVLIITKEYLKLLGISPNQLPQH